MKSAQIRAISCYLPEHQLGNDELVARFSGWTTEKMERKLGIVTRPIAADGQTATDMGVEAGKRLLESGAVDRNSVDFLVFCTQSPDYFLPTSACLIQERLGLPKKCGATDINLGCSGYIYGLALCKGLIEAGLAKKVLFITSETYSKYINEDDRASRPLFGDGASATLLEAVDEKETPSNNVWLGPFEFGTDGSGSELLIVPAGAQRLPISDETGVVRPDMRGNFRSQEQLQMRGPGIFNFAVDVVPPLVDSMQRTCRNASLSIDTYIFHQANRYMLDRLQELCDLGSARYYNNMRTRGNTVSSSIPIAILDALSERFFRPGESSLLVGFGVGLSWGACRVVLPDDFVAIP